MKHDLPIYASDIDSLEAILFASNGPGTCDDFVAVYGIEQPLGRLVRQILGLDRGAAKEAFAGFFGRATMTSDHIMFIKQIIDHIVQNGLIDPAEPFATPFTDLDDQGAVSVFREEPSPVVGAIEKINNNAVVA